MAKLQSGTRIYGTANIDSVLIVGNVTSNNTTAANTGSLQVYGGTSVTGNVFAGGDAVVGANDGSPLTGATNPIIVAIGNSNNYIQSYQINYSNTIYASSDFVAYPHNGRDANGWINFGITSNTFNYPIYSVTGRNEGYIFMSAPGGSGTSGNLIIATDSTGVYNSIEFVVGGFNKGKTNSNVTFTTQTTSTSNVTGTIIVRGGVGITGNTYTTNAFVINTMTVGTGNGIASSSNTTGTLLVNGGLGVTGNIYVANVFTSGGIYDANTKLPIAGGGGGGSINVVNDITTSATFYPMLSTITSNTLSTTYVSTTKLYFNPLTGTFSATSFNSLSDENYKENIETIIDGLNIVDKINPVSFNWKDNNKKSYGVIAQEIEKIIPEIVDTTENDIKTVSYDQIIPFLIQAVQQLKKEIEDLKSQK